MDEIDQLIICNPYEKPKEYWKFNLETRKPERIVGKRRPAGYIIASPENNAIDDPGAFYPIQSVNIIRERVDRWRDKGYPGVTGITRQLLEFWNDPTMRQAHRFFFCQLEAIETIIWMIEAPESEKKELGLGSDGGLFKRLCSKMATGTGKTVVMAMVIAWQILNKVSYPQDKRFSKHIVVVAPGLTVKSRLQVLWPPDQENSYYHLYSIIPDSMYENLRHGKLKIHNWHTLKPVEDQPHSVVRRGVESDEAFAKRILEHKYNNIIVINDEAHHAWRKLKDGHEKHSDFESNMDELMATLWIEGLDKLDRARTIVTCFDFTATPFIPSQKKPNDDILFKWIISDFSLNDAIESGLVKTPRMPAGDDGKSLKYGDRSKYYHIYDNDKVKSDLKGAKKPETILPDLVRNAYILLGNDWAMKRKELKKSNINPVMITVCNSVHTSARVVHFFKNSIYKFEELADENRMCRIDTSVLKSERGEKQSAKTDAIREIINTVGQKDKPGEQIMNIIAVQMLSEGWDAKNVTHIMGLRAFTSQLLCEQVVGRGLRRLSYEIDPETGLLDKEYVNILGVPFSFLPHENTPSKVRKEKVKTRIACDPINIQYEISWPNIARIETIITPVLKINWKKVSTLRIRSKVTTTIHVAPMLDSKLDISRASEITLQKSYNKLRMQTIIFQTVSDIYDHITIPEWSGNKNYLFFQIVKIVEKFIELDKIKFLNLTDELKIRKHLAIMFNMKTIVMYIHEFIRADNTKSKKIIFGDTKQQKSTNDMQAWYTTKKVVNATKSHINPSPCDNKWEEQASKELEKNERVVSWVKNYISGFNVKYQFKGEIHNYNPDYLVQLENNVTLILEIKGQHNEQTTKKHDALKEWVETVNSDGRFGKWEWDVAYDPDDVHVIIKKHADR